MKERRGELSGGSTMTPVFCAQCEHYISGYSDQPYEYCAVARSPGQAMNYLHVYDVDPPTPAEKNARNNCADYQAIIRTPKGGKKR